MASSIPVLDAALAFRVVPGYGSANAGDPARAALETAGELYDHLSRFAVQRVKVAGTNGDAPAFFAQGALSLVELDVALAVVLYRVKGDLFFYLHFTSSSGIESP
jgi:hypothetical protein